MCLICTETKEWVKNTPLDLRAEIKRLQKIVPLDKMCSNGAGYFKAVSMRDGFDQEEEQLDLNLDSWNTDTIGGDGLPSEWGDKENQELMDAIDALDDIGLAPGEMIHFCKKGSYPIQGSDRKHYYCCKICGDEMEEV